MTFDTLKAAKQLQEKDTFTPEQAERIAEVLSDTDAASATQDDLDEARNVLQTDIRQAKETISTRIDQVEEQLNARIDQVEAKLSARIDKLDVELRHFITSRIAWATGLLALWIALLDYLA